MKNMNLTFEDKKFRRLSNNREILLACGDIKASNWEEFIFEMSELLSKELKNELQ